MVITSRLRTLFLVRKGLSFLIIDIICIVLISSFFNDGSYLETLFFGSIFIFILVYQYMNFNSVKSLIVTSKGITTISFLSESKEFIPFSDIENIKTNGQNIILIIFFIFSSFLRLFNSFVDANNSFC